MWTQTMEFSLYALIKYCREFSLKKTKLHGLSPRVNYTQNNICENGVL
jgi:hypothetical protein